MCISRLLRTKCIYKKRNVFFPLVIGSESDLNEVILCGYRSDLRLVYKLRHIPLSKNNKYICIKNIVVKKVNT